MSGIPSPFAAWFNVPEHADVLINVYVDTGDSTGREGVKTGCEDEAAGDAAAPPARSYHCHAIVLATYSGYFKAQLSSTWSQGQQQPPPSSGTKQSVDVHVEVDELDAMHELLFMMYSQALPATTATTEALFVQCLRLADRFQAASSVELLVAALAAIPSSDIVCEVLEQVFQAAPGVRISRSYSALLASCIKSLSQMLCGAPAEIGSNTPLGSCIKVLVQLFGNIPEVISNKDLLQQFCSLPYAAVLAWVQSDELQVLSENCVVFLVTAWVKANQDSTAAQHEELAHQIRVFHLGPAYLHQILPILSWFRSCSGIKHLNAVQCCQSAGITMKEGGEKEGRLGSDLGWPPAWMAKPRQRSNSSRTGSWVLGPSQLKEMDNGTGQYLSPPVYVNGFLMWIYMDQAATAPPAAAPGKTLGVYSGVNRTLMERRGLPVPDNIMLVLGPVSLQMGSPDSQLSMEGSLGVPCILECDCFWGAPDFLGSSAPTVLELAAPYLREEQLRVQATFTGVDVVL